MPNGSLQAMTDKSNIVIQIYWGFARHFRRPIFQESIEISKGDDFHAQIRDQ
jgi:hypothetical protein